MITTDSEEQNYCCMKNDLEISYKTLRRKYYSSDSLLSSSDALKLGFISIASLKPDFTSYQFVHRLY
jgi:hypothetical protein